MLKGATMAFILKIEGEDQVLTSGLDSFVKAHGWSETSKESQLEFATTIIKNFLRNSIQSYVIEQARAQAAKLAHDASKQALDMMTTTLEKVEIE